MGKKILSISLLLVICFALIYSIYSHINERQITESEYMDEELFMKLLQEPPNEQDQEQIENQQVELRYIDEEIYVEEGDHDHIHSHEESEPDVIAAKGKAINFNLTTFDGEKVKLSDYLGKKVLINFWATWCPPCEDEMPHIEEYYEKYAEKHNVVILGINTTDLESNVKTVQKFVQDHEVTFPILLDEVGEVSTRYEILTLPTSFIIDENGNLVEQIIGPVTDEMLVEKFG
ncbi:TlpA disulfide reductase family protein [Lysinibacillus endophyticus]|uniref:peroxiredoxin family protein n=1 Tax=Ureibacillus endophyticus TaxID=1978490 RepID=UPI0031365A25